MKEWQLQMDSDCGLTTVSISLFVIVVCTMFALTSSFLLLRVIGVQGSVTKCGNSSSVNIRRMKSRDLYGN